MRTVNVTIFKRKNYFIVRVYAAKRLKGGDYLKPTLDECYKLVEDLNKMGITQ